MQALRQSLRRASLELLAGRERALQQERIRAWGEMARRIAHEMKNPLTPLRLAAHRLNEATEHSAQVVEPLRVIEEETRRLEQLAHEFSLLGRPATGPRSAVDVVELLTSLAQTDVPAGIRIQLQAADELPLVLADYNALQQALRNVIRNAVEAVASRPDGYIAIAVDLPQANGQLRLTFGDNGPGFPPGSAERAFLPDYTTKPRGTGLGLAIARQTIEEHGGTISAASGAAGGAQVEIILPAQAGTAA